MQAFVRTRLGDFLATPYIGLQSPPEGGSFRIRLHWAKFDTGEEVSRRAHVVVQQQHGGELQAFRELLDFGVGSDLILSGIISPDVEAIRVVVTPVGEEISLIPKRIEVDFDPNTVRKRWPREAEPEPMRSGIDRLRAIVDRLRSKRGSGPAEQRPS